MAIVRTSTAVAAPLDRVAPALEHGPYAQWVVGTVEVTRTEGPARKGRPITR